MQSFHHPVYGLSGFGQPENVVSKTKVIPNGSTDVTIQAPPPPPATPPAPMRKAGIGMITTPLAMGIGYSRSRKAGRGQLQSIGLAFLLGIVSKTYLAYVAYDTYIKKK